MTIVQPKERHSLKFSTRWARSGGRQAVVSRGNGFPTLRAPHSNQFAGIRRELLGRSLDRRVRISRFDAADPLALVAAR